MDDVTTSRLVDALGRIAAAFERVASALEARVKADAEEREWTKSMLLTFQGKASGGADHAVYSEELGHEQV